jgi:hypothetical protein
VSDRSANAVSFTRTLRLKVRAEAYSWLNAAAIEVNAVWNWANATGHILPQAHEGNCAQWCAMKMTGITFAAWLRQRKNKAGTYLVNVTGHYVLVSGRKFVDTYTKGEWVNIGKAPHRRTRVVKVWEITK